MPQRNSLVRLGQGLPGRLSMAKSGEAEKAGATQHRPQQRSQSGLRPGWSAGEGSSISSSRGMRGFFPEVVRPRSVQNRRTDARSETNFGPRGRQGAGREARRFGRGLERVESQEPKDETGPQGGGPEAHRPQAGGFAAGGAERGPAVPAGPPPGAPRPG